MTNLTFNTSWTGTPNEFDINAAHFLVDLENAKLAAEEPPGTPLPKSNNAQLKSSVETILNATQLKSWSSYGDQAVAAGYVAGTPEKTNSEVKDLYKNATDAGRLAAIAALEANQA